MDVFVAVDDECALPSRLIFSVERPIFTISVKVLQIQYTLCKLSQDIWVVVLEFHLSAHPQRCPERQKLSLTDLMQNEPAKEK